MSDSGYIDYFAVLGLEPDCKPGEVKKTYKVRMKALVMEISRSEITPESKDSYILELARHNAAFFILRDSGLREAYVTDRKRVMELEVKWREAVASDSNEVETLRRQFDAAVRHFLSRYMEELLLMAGRDPECVEASRWDPAHERHGGPVLRRFRQQLYQEIHERLPFYEVTPPVIDWTERTRVVSETMATEGA